jgi:hypothetical protein
VSGYDPRPVRRDDLASPLAGLWAGELPPDGGDLVQSLTYRQTYTPITSHDPPAPRRLTADAPDLLRMAAGGAWALASLASAGSVLLLVIVVAVRLVGVLT